MAHRSAARPAGLVVVLLTGLLLRVLWWIMHVRVIENEGAEYARLADNIFTRGTHDGLLGSINLASSPLLPVLIGLVNFVTGDLEVAGRVVSLIAGVMLVAFIFLLAGRLFGPAAALPAGLLAAAHPVLVGLSVSVFSESLSMALTMAGAYFATVAVQAFSVRHAALAGAVLGLGYWVRPELLVFAASVLGVSLLWAMLRRAERRPALLTGLSTLAVAGLIAAPYMVFLSLEAGRFQWEGKSLLNDITNQRMAAGMSYMEASHGIGASLDPEPPYEEGPNLTADHRRFIRAPQIGMLGWGERLRQVIQPWRLRMTAEEVWTTGSIGAPAIVALALVGFLFSGWWRRQWVGGLVLASFGLLQVATLFAVEHHFGRYFFPLAPVLIPWAAAGIAVLAALAGGRAADGSAQRPRLAAMLAVLAALAVALTAYGPARQVIELRETLDESVKTAGMWIRQDLAERGTPEVRPLLMGFSNALAFYADAESYSLLPYADPSQAVEYVRRKAPDYIGLRSSERGWAPYVEDWVRQGIPDDCAAPAFQAESSIGVTIRVWRWTCRD